MAIKYKEIKNIAKLSDASRSRLADLTHGDKGLMKLYVKNRHVDYPAVLAVDTAEKTIVGWTVFMDGEHLRRMHGDTQKLDIFVDDKYRGQGVGKTLMYKAAVMAKERGIKKFKINPHDKKSAGIYGSFGAKYVTTPSRLGLSKSEREAEKIKRAQSPMQPGVAVSPDHFTDDHEEATANLSVRDMLKKIKNPETGNDITVQSALKYDKTHPARQLAMKVLRKGGKQ